MPPSRSAGRAAIASKAPPSSAWITIPVSSQPSLATRRISSNRPILKFQICLASFSQCALANAKFEGARLVGTRFERLHDDALRGAQFGKIENFEYIYSGSRLIEDRDIMRKWTREQTGMVEPGSDPCPILFSSENCSENMCTVMGLGGEMNFL
jgi:hypothetical protein